jgi:branched-chain amino acid transport system substrate-binding protein
LSNEDCSTVSIHYPLDSYSLARPVVESLVKQGDDSWFVVALDASFGADIVKDVTAFLRESGGSLAGTVRHPINTSDFSSFLLTAQQSGAKVIAIANAGADTTNSIKTARQFGLFDSGKQRLAALYILIDDIHALGIKDMQGLLLAEAWYWDLNDDTRAWAKRFYERTKRMPNSDHASVYSSTIQYLRAIEKTGSDDVSVVFPQMRKTPINDMFAKGGYIREDGRMVHDMYLFEVKKPSESKGPWDTYNLLATIPGDQAFQPLSESKCPLVAGK